MVEYAFGMSEFRHSHPVVHRLRSVETGASVNPERPWVAEWKCGSSTIYGRLFTEPPQNQDRCRVCFRGEV